MLASELARPLFDQSWTREGDALVRVGEHGTRLRFAGAHEAWQITVLFDEKPVLGYELRVSAERLPELVRALAENSAELDRLNHPGFSRAVAGIADEAVVTATEGYRIRPRLENGELRWEPLD